MAGEIDVFGACEDGEPVHRVTIAGGGLTASVLSWGAVVQDLRLSSHDLPLVLGYPRFEDYRAHSPYFGAIAGRYANRIGGARAAIDGHAHEFDPNFLGKHTLHGGRASFAKRLWTIADHGEDHVTLTLRSADGDMGFPGNLSAACTYRVGGDGVLSITLSAETDQPTLVNLTNHSYFNLDDGGIGDILDHRMRISADAYLPVDAELIPTGIVQPVGGTLFDFRALRQIRMEIEGDQVDYDHNFCLSAGRVPLRTVALVEAANSRVRMEVRTTEPGLQFYAGHKITQPAVGLLGAPYSPRAGFCLETQVWPDSPSRSYFPQALLRPGETSVQVTEYVFSQG
jgi:aldose 1-epimerase